MRFHFTDTELKALLASMVVLIDSREQCNEHIKTYLEQKKVNFEVHKLDFGDYSCLIPKNEELCVQRPLFFTESCVIERKGSLDELAGNLTKDRTRFESELLRAKGANIALMVENATYSDVVMGRYRSEYKPKSFVATLATFSARYGLDVNFVEKELAGNWIYHRLYYAVREELLHGC
jgi:ERCC4-type nuclease